MMKRPIYLFCAVCLAWSCSNDPITAESDRAPGSPAGEPVPIGLTLHMADFETPPSGITRSVRATASGARCGLVDVEISPAETAPATRAGEGEVFVIPDDQKIFRLDILQFNGTGNNAQLIKKEVLTQAEGDLAQYNFKDLTFISTSSTVKNRVVVFGNAPASLSDGMQVKAGSTAGSTYGSLLLEKMSRTEDNASIFPLIRAGYPADVPVFAGTTTTTVASGSQIGVELTRTIAKVNFEILISPAMKQAYTDWDIVMNSIPPASFYNPLAYEAPFPEMQITAPYYSRVMGLGIKSPQDPAAMPLLKTGFYLPVNLQYQVPGTTVPNRYPHAPVNATSLQILGKKIENGSITQTVLYMIPLGSNFTDDYSIRPNNAINYRITLVSDSPDDASVVKFIAGKFAGKFRQYTNSADGTECWGFEDDLEVWPTDVEYKYYEGDDTKPVPPDGITNMCWMYYDNLVPEPQSTTVTMNDGLFNTQELCKNLEGDPRVSYWSRPTAAYMCYRQLNGLTAPLATPDPHMWFLPAINQLVGIYVAGGAQVGAMQSRYWSSTLKTFSWPYEAYYLGKDGTLGVTRAYTWDDGSYNTAAVRGCRIPPPVSLSPKRANNTLKIN